MVLLSSTGRTGILCGGFVHGQSQIEYCKDYLAGEL